MQFLDQAPMRTPFMIESVQAATDNTIDLSKHLESLGFLPNEQVELLSCAPFSSDPIIVRIGLSKFALRRAEAAYVKIKPL